MLCSAEAGERSAGEQADTLEQTENEVMEGLKPTVSANDTGHPREQVCRRLDRVKWCLWHGNVGRALDEMAHILCIAEEATNGTDGMRKLLRAAKEFETYLERNGGLIPDYSDRYRHGDTISTAFVESAVNRLLATSTRKATIRDGRIWPLLPSQGKHQLPEVGISHFL